VFSRGKQGDVIELLQELGRMLQSIDARLDEIVELLRAEDDDE